MDIVLSVLNNIYVKLLFERMIIGAVAPVIIWLLDLQLSMHLVPITTDLLSLNLDQRKVCNIM